MRRSVLNLRRISTDAVKDLLLAGHPDDAITLLTSHPKPHPTTSSLLLTHLSKLGRTHDAVELLENLVRKGSIPRLDTSFSLMKTLLKTEGPDGVVRLLTVLEQAEKGEFLGEICDRFVVYLCRKGFFKAALDVFEFARIKGFNLGRKAYYAVAKRVIFDGRRRFASAMLSVYLKEYGVGDRRVLSLFAVYLCKESVSDGLNFVRGMGVRRLSSCVTNAVVDCLVRDGRVEEALEFVVEGGGKGFKVDVIGYSIVVDGLCKEGYMEKALELCEVMRTRACEPNVVTYNSVINGLCLQGSIMEAFRLFDSFEQNNVVPTVVTYGILIDALCWECFLDDAHQLFDRMILNRIDPSTHIYNSLIYGHSRMGSVMESIKLLHDLESNSLQPDAFTVSALINAFCVKGDMEGSLRFYAKHKQKGLPPDLLGFTGLVQGLCARGRMEEARNIMRDMLKCENVTYMIDQTGAGVDMESLSGFIGSLCEDGSVKNAVNLLIEICNYSFASKRCKGLRRDIHLKVSEIDPAEMGNGNFSFELGHSTSMQLKKHEDNSDLKHSVEPSSNKDTLLHDLGMENESLVNDEMVSDPPTKDFEAYYSLVASLCSKGELKKANSAVQMMLHNYKERS